MRIYDVLLSVLRMIFLITQKYGMHILILHWIHLLTYDDRHLEHEGKFEESSAQNETSVVLFKDRKAWCTSYFSDRVGVQGTSTLWRMKTMAWRVHQGPGLAMRTALQAHDLVSSPMTQLLRISDPGLQCIVFQWCVKMHWMNLVSLSLENWISAKSKEF